MSRTVSHHHTNLYRSSSLLSCLLAVPGGLCYARVNFINPMPSVRIPKGDNRGVYFITMTAIEWINFFTNPPYFEVLASALKYCIQNKGLLLYEYVLMTNHIHLIIGSKGELGVDAIIRDFKRHTTKEMKKLVENDNRKFLKVLIKYSFSKKKGAEFQIWKRENYPEYIETDDFLATKIQYIRNNPVKKRYVSSPEDWLYSSAKQKILELPDDHYDVMVPCCYFE
jgi:putative transposase